MSDLMPAKTLTAYTTIIFGVIFASISTTLAAESSVPLKGANSFTESQAKQLIIAKGLQNVSTLKQDSQGIWRGTAQAGSQIKAVAVDFKGNVVAK